MLLCFSGVLILQKAHTLLCRLLCTPFLPETMGQYEALMIHHTFMFLTAFIPTLILGKCRDIDLGYHAADVRSGAECLLAVCAFSLFFSLIDGLFGVKMILDRQSIAYFTFQFFFSGAGEEIIFRTIPIAAFDLFCHGKSCSLKVGCSETDLSSVMSSVLFAAAHIPNFYGKAYYQQIYGFAVVFIMGMLYAWTYRRTNSVFMCMIVHGTSNVLTAVFPIISAALFG